jgi:GTP cyclohydrolase I
MPPMTSRLISTAGRAESRTDLAAAETAAAAFLTALGVSLDDEHTHETPRRMAKAYAELLSAEDFAMTTFDAGGYTGLVGVRKVRFTSLCAHHALPFTGSADVGYLPGERIAGLSKLARLVRAVASGPQVQERMTVQIADRLDAELAPRGIAVRVRATHLCLTARGARATGSVMITAELRGLLADDASVRAEWAHGVSATTIDHLSPGRGCPGD